LVDLVSLLKIVAPKRIKPQGVAYTNTFNPDQKDQVLTSPVYREHLTDIFSSRAAQDSRDLLKSLFVHDPDVSAALAAHLTLADTTPLIRYLDENGVVDRAGQMETQGLISALTERYDYSKGFLHRPSLREICTNLRYMLLLRGAIGAELVVDKAQIPVEIRQVDMATIEWFEREPNRYIPIQKPVGSDAEINLDIPTFFVGYHRRDPTTIYSYGSFVSAINTISARQQVVNDLYRIMQQTGYPRMEVTVMEDVILRNAPASVKMNPVEQTNYVNNQISQIRTAIANLRPDQALIHTDSVVPGILNDKSPGMGIDVDSIIGVLNAQNQAGLRTMSTILGRGESGVNTASVEARLFSMTAEALNIPIGDLLSKILTLGVRARGLTGRVEVEFDPVEMRPDIELEPQRLARQTRLHTDLSLGLITDEEYHLRMYRRLRPEGAPELSGTGFMISSPVDVGAISPNSDPMGRSLTPDGNSNAAADGKVQKGPKPVPKK
jgi:hypothetical protein